MERIRRWINRPASAALPGAALLTMLASHALAQGRLIYRCGNEYTNDVSSARARQCQLIEGGNVTTIQGTSAHSSGTASKARHASAPRRTGAAVAGNGSPARVDSGVQRERDQQARRILDAELARSQARLLQLQEEYKDGKPDRLGGERNNQLYLDRTNRLKTDIARTQSDINGIQREIARLPGTP